MRPLGLALVTASTMSAASPAFHVELRGLGGVVIGEAFRSPLMPSRLDALALTGFVEAAAGLWLPRFEVNGVVRGGNGRLAGLEVGIRPFSDWFTVLAGYSVWWLDASALPRGRWFGHGPWATVDVAFDPREVAPRRFGAFFSAGASWFPLPDGGRPLLFGNVEAGLRWRLL